MMRSKVATSLLLLTIFLLSIQSPLLLENSQSSETSGRAQTIWSGQVTLNNHYTIPVTDELVIEECTNVTMSNDVRIYVEGRITVEGQQIAQYTSIMLAVETTWVSNSIPLQMEEVAELTTPP